VNTREKTAPSIKKNDVMMRRKGICVTVKLVYSVLSSVLTRITKKGHKWSKKGRERRR